MTDDAAAQYAAHEQRVQDAIALRDLWEMTPTLPCARCGERHQRRSFPVSRGGHEKTTPLFCLTGLRGDLS